jgi:hypothetical protein
LRVLFSNKLLFKEKVKRNLHAWLPCNPIKALKKENRLRKGLGLLAQ